MKKLLLILLLIWGCSDPTTSPSSIDIESIVNEEFSEGSDSGKYMSLQTILSDHVEKNEDFSNMLNGVSFDKLALESLLAYEKGLLSQWDSLPMYSTLGEKVPKSRTQRCGTLDRAARSALRVPKQNVENNSHFFLFEYSRIEIPLRFHIIYNDDGFLFSEETEGKTIEKKITPTFILSQLNTINQIFNPYKISFYLASIDSIRHTDWNHYGAFYYGDKHANEMFHQLSIHPENSLNIYIIGSGKDSLLGEASFPWDDSEGKYNDYVVINGSTIPGVISNPIYRYGKGKTLVHEIGHYLGLWHTFHGSSAICEDATNNGCYWGDKVADTPAQNICHGNACGCEASACDTCKEAGKDPVNNYMGYNDDACMSEFTNGQISRIFKVAYLHRPYFFITEGV